MAFNFVMPSVVYLSVANKPIKLNVIMLNFVMLNIVMLSVVMLSVVAPFCFQFNHFLIIQNAFPKNKLIEQDAVITFVSKKKTKISTIF